MQSADMVPGDLVARLAWLSEHDRRTLVQVLATVDPHALDVARRLAVRGVGPECPRPVDNLGNSGG